MGSHAPQPNSAIPAAASKIPGFEVANKAWSWLDRDYNVEPRHRLEAQAGSLC
jgi:hypothetical protein